MNNVVYIAYLLRTLLADMQLPLGVRRLTDIATPITLPRGTYVWKLEPDFHNAVSYRVKLNHAASGAAGRFRFVGFDDKRTPGTPDLRLQSDIMTRNAGQTSEWQFTKESETVFLGIEAPNDNTAILLTTSPPADFRGLNPFWLKGGINAQGNELQPGAVGDLNINFTPPDQDLGERYPALQIHTNNGVTANADLTRFYHVDFEQVGTVDMTLEFFCADMVQHFLAAQSGLPYFERRAQWQQNNPGGTERQYLSYLLLRLTQQPLNFPDRQTLPERLTRRWRTNFVAPEAFDKSSIEFAIEILLRDLVGRNTPFQLGQELDNENSRRRFPENVVAFQVPLQSANAGDVAAVEVLRAQIAAVRPKLPQLNSVQLILEVLYRALDIDRLLAKAWTALTRNESGIAAAALAAAEDHTRFLFQHNYGLQSEISTSGWARYLADEDRGQGPNTPLRRYLPDQVRLLARRNRGNTLVSITTLLRPGTVVPDEPQAVSMYTLRAARSPTRIKEVAEDVRFVPTAAELGKVVDQLVELYDANDNYTQLNDPNKRTLEDNIIGLWNLVPHYVHFQLPLAYAELHRQAGRHDAARHFLEIILDDDDAGPGGMVRYPFLNARIELPGIALRSARNSREHGDSLLRAMDSESRVLAEEAYARARRLLALAVDPDNPIARMELMACDVGLQKIRHGLNIYGYSEDYIPLFRYQPMVALASELAQQALDAGRQLLSFWQQAEQAQRAEIEASHVITLNERMVEVETLRLNEAATMFAVAELQAQQVDAQIEDLGEKITELSDPVFFLAAVATGVQSGLGLATAGLALGGPIGLLSAVIITGATTGPGVVVGGPIGGLVGFGAGGLAGAYLGYAQGAAQWKAHESNLNDQKRAKALLEKFGTQIAAKQVEAARTQTLIAERMTEIARLRLNQSREIAALLREQFFNADRFYQLADQMREIYRTLLRHAMKAAFMAEQALEFELNERINVIGFSYDQPGEQLVLGAERLRTDLATLRTQRIERYSAKRLPACISISLAEEFPLELFQMRTTGKTTIRTDLSFLERLYPGAYQARISRIELAFFALTPQVGLHGTVRSSGVSYVKDQSGNAVALIVPPEVMYISRYQYRDGAYYFALPEEQLHSFEGSGMATDFTIELPAVANNFERSTIADLHLIIHFTALNSARLEADVIGRRPASGVAMRSFSLHEAFSDAFFDLVNNENCRFVLGPRHFPQTHRNPRITRIMLLTALKPETGTETVAWKLDYTDQARVNRKAEIVVNRRAPVLDQNPAGASFAGMSAFGEWKLSGRFVNQSGNPIPLQQDLSELVLFIEYEHGR